MNAVEPVVQNNPLLKDNNFNSKLNISSGFGKVQLYFIPNKGQVDAKARFYAKTSNYTLWMTSDGLVFDKTRTVVGATSRSRFPVNADDAGYGVNTVSGKAVGGVSAPRPSVTAESAVAGISHKESGHRDPSHKSGLPEHTLRTGVDPSNIGSGRRDPSHKDTTYERNVSRLMFIGANRDAEITAGAVTDHRVNYFIGNDKSKWHADIETSKSVIYKNIYKNIDLKVYGIEKQIEYDWIIHPGADPAKISFKYENVKSTKIDRTGNLVVHTDFGDLVHSKPVSYQVIDGKKVDVEVLFVINENGEYGFKAERYNLKYDLIIDPLILDYSTYLGGSSYERGLSIAVDSSGSAYVTGQTESINFPLQNQYQGDQTGDDTFVTKFSSSGNTLVYSTYLGGDGDDYGNGIAVDSNQSAYITGMTESTNFPLQNQYQGDQAISDAFVTKLSPSGNALDYSTYLGGNSSDEGYGIAVDSAGSAYITGQTASTNFPLQNQYQGDQTGQDIFVTKLSSSGNTLVYSTYLGGNGTEYGYGIAVDSNQSAYVTGRTASTNFPLQNQYQGDQTGDDTFVTKFSSSGNTLVYSTYLGGNGTEYGSGIAVDSNQSAYVTGMTESTDFPLQNQYQGNQNGHDVFVTKLSSSGNTLVYSTYLGGSGVEYGLDIVVDSNQSAYITGMTDSTDFPLEDQYQGDQLGVDAFVTKLSSSGNALVYSTYLGGNSDDYGSGIAVDSNQSAYVTGMTDSTTFPLENQYQGDQLGADAFVTKLILQSPITAPVAVLSADHYGGIAPAIINFDGSGSYDTDGTVVAWRWNFGDGATGTGELISHEYPSVGTYMVTLRVRDNDGEWSTIVTEQISIYNADELSCSLESRPASIKANGRETAVISTILYYSPTDGSPSMPLFENLKVSFSTANGRFFSVNQFDPATGEYSDILTSGVPSVGIISASLGGTEICSTEVAYTWPQPPVNLEAEFKENRGLFVGEYWVYLTWAANTADIYTPAKYKIWRAIVSETGWVLVTTVDSSTFSYTDEGVDPKIAYIYGVSTVDTAGDESEILFAK